MLSRSLSCLGICRVAIRNTSSVGGKGPKDPNAKDVLGSDLLDAVNAVADEIHGSDADAKKSTRSALISKLVLNDKATFNEATSAQTSSMLDDKVILDLLSDVASDTKALKQPKPHQIRQEKKVLVLLRKDVFYQAIQSGYKTEEARNIAERAVEEAQDRLSQQRKLLLTEAKSSRVEDLTQASGREEKERKLFEYAYEKAEKMLYQDDVIGVDGISRKTVRPDPSVESLLKTEKRLGIYKELQSANDHSLEFWPAWDLRSARITNKSMGPANSFEEQIEWTSTGKQWPFPIDNEYLGEEAETSFLEHIFLDRHLQSLGIPKTGPVAHFMHLVCVGLSKNPYMTAAKKMEHLKWFANYFNAEKQKLVKKLHEEEQLAAQNAS